MGRELTRWVVLPGLAETAEEFAAVRDLLPDAYDVLVVDPWRTPVTAPLASLQDLAGPGPLGLVGHSIGGLAALRWTLSAPSDVAALVLVDTSLPHEDGWTVFHPGAPGDRAVRLALAGIGEFGVPRVLGPVLRDGLFKLSTLSGNDPLPRATVSYRYGAEDSWMRFWNELAGSWPLAAEVESLLQDRCEHAAPPLPPIIQLVAGGARFGRVGRRWLRGQHELSERLRSGLVVLPDAAHLVHLDRPDAIAAAITGSLSGV